MRKQRERKISVRYRCLIRTLLRGTFCVNVNPLMVDSGIGKKIYTLLVDNKPF